MSKASIIVRTYNEEEHIGNLLDSFKTQSYQDYEVIVVDSGSSDQTLNIVRDSQAKLIQIESRDFTFGYALNVGCGEAVGDYLVFVSAHVLPTNEYWLENLLKPFEDQKVAMVYGRQVGTSESKFSEKIDFQRLFGSSPINSAVPSYYANNANSAIRRILWEEEKFDEYLFGLEDIDWARNHDKKNFIVHYEPKAAVYHIHNEKWSQVFNRYRREAIAAVRIGLQKPPQAGLGFFWLASRFIIDLLYSFPNYTPKRLEEIIRFRYYQWKGSRTGWAQGRDLDIDVDRNNVFYPIRNEAVLIQGVGDAKYQEVKLPELKPGDVLIKVDYVGVCRTDIEVYDGTLGYYRDDLAEYPIVPGHEFSGTVVRIGSNNKYQERFKIGDRVIVECIHSRGEVSDRKEVGVINQNGAYSQFVVMPGEFLHKVPKNISQKEAALAEPIAVVLRAIRRLEHRISEKSNIAIIGAGQIGNLSAQILALQGHHVTVFDKNDSRLEMLRSKVDKTESSLDALDRFDIIIEATGSATALESVLKGSRFDGTIMLLGFPYGDMQYNFEDFVGNEKVIIGSVGSDKEDFAESLEILPKIDMGEYTKKIMPLEDYEKAWDIHASLQYLKILLKP
jgi:2-desacetyl-2-hydroxyethyl bacteriochlorophyllide A dehydrogenase